MRKQVKNKRKEEEEEQKHDKQYNNKHTTFEYKQTHTDKRIHTKKYRQHTKENEKADAKNKTI